MGRIKRILKKHVCRKTYPRLSRESVVPSPAREIGEYFRVDPKGSGTWFRI
jgi:hypothetical protein